MLPSYGCSLGEEPILLVIPCPRTAPLAAYVIEIVEACSRFPPMFWVGSAPSRCREGGGQLLVSAISV